jgi:hypothetical protein
MNNPNFIVENNELFFFTHSNYCKDYTISIINYWKNQNSNTQLYIVDFYENSVTELSSKNSDVKKIHNINLVNKFSSKCEATSFPSFCVHRNGECKEYICGNYSNIFSIIDYYL